MEKACYNGYNTNPLANGLLSGLLARLRERRGGKEVFRDWAIETMESCLRTDQVFSVGKRFFAIGRLKQSQGRKLKEKIEAVGKRFFAIGRLKRRKVPHIRVLH